MITVKYLFVSDILFPFSKSTHSISSLIDNYRIWLDSSTPISITILINRRTLPLPSSPYIATNMIFPHSLGWRRPIISKGGKGDSQSTYACVSILYLVMSDYMTFHNSKFLTIFMLKKYHLILTTCCSIVGSVYCCVTCVKLTMCRSQAIWEEE